MQMAGGAAIFGIFIVVYTLAVASGLYSRRGSAINQRPYRDPHGDAPGASRPSSLMADPRSRDGRPRGLKR